MIGAITWMMLFFVPVLAQDPPDETPPPTPPTATRAIERPLPSEVHVELRLEKSTVPIGSPVVVEFVVQNRTGEPVTLSVPGAPNGKIRGATEGMGLPLEHVFSGVNFRGLEVASEDNPNMGDRVTRKPEYPVPSVTLAPYASIGLRFDVARFYPGLHQAGTYDLSWKPYGGALQTNTLTLKVVSYKQAVIQTEYGDMTMRFLYDKAPRHVANFIELADQRFYNGKAFDTVYRDQFILGGCPEGDGSGKRPDGVCLKPEFNDTPFEAGVVGMALIEGDVNSASCQFFICLADQPGWNGRYTAFARIVGPESMETLRKLGEVATDKDHHPLKPLKIKTLTITDAPFIPSASQ